MLSCFFSSKTPVDEPERKTEEVKPPPPKPTEPPPEKFVIPQNSGLRPVAPPPEFQGGFGNSNSAPPFESGPGFGGGSGGGFGGGSGGGFGGGSGFGGSGGIGNGPPEPANNKNGTLPPLRKSQKSITNLLLYPFFFFLKEIAGVL